MKDIPYKKPLNEKKEDLITHFYRFFFHTKPGRIISFILFVLLYRQYFNFGIFGVRTAFLAAFAIYLWIITERDILIPLERKEKADFLIFGIVLIPTLIIGFFETTFLWQQYEAGELTREISGNPNAWAECQRFTPALVADSITAGYYAPSQDADKSVIQYIYCNEWGNFYYSNKESIDDIKTLWALGTVIHEAIHVAGERNEAITQCLTNKVYPNILRRYNISQKKIQEFTERYIQQSYRMPDDYLHGNCSEHPLLKRLLKL